MKVSIRKVFAIFLFLIAVDVLWQQFISHSNNTINFTYYLLLSWILANTK